MLVSTTNPMGFMTMKFPVLVLVQHKTIVYTTIHSLPQWKYSFHWLDVRNHKVFFSVKIDGGRSSVVSASEFQSEYPGFDPLGRMRGSFSVPQSTLVQTYLCLIPLCVYSTHPNLCAR